MSRDFDGLLLATGGLPPDLSLCAELERELRKREP